ncbi:hypothetical protein [Pedobacter sp. R-06]|uniref:hypothetical protein n=1 Tax=Pedobacter sp. R-06 TaxID=3404051 RepID=UPI003CF469DD
MGNNIRNTLLAIVAIGLLGACNSTGKLTRRYKSIKYATSGKMDSLIKVSGYAVTGDAVEQAKPKSIFDLNAEAQAELIKQIGIKETDNAKFVSALSSSLSPKSTGGIDVLDLTRFQKRIVISVKKLKHHPADRINMIDVTLSLPEGTKLLSCNRLMTEYQTLEFGKLNYSNTASASLTGNAGSGFSSVLTNGGSTNRTLVDADGNAFKNEGTGSTGTNTFSNTSVNGSTNGLSSTTTGSLGLTATGTGSRTFAEEVMLRQRIVGLQASISKNDLNLFQNGGLGIDLSGNIIADIVFEIKESPNTERIISFTDLLDIAGKANPADKLKIKDFILIYPGLIKDVEADLKFNGEYRWVKDGDRTISESDDVVSLISGNGFTEDKVNLIPANILKPKMWTISIPVKGGELPLEISLPTVGSSGKIIFNSATEARNFIAWLKASYTTIPESKTLGTSGHVLVLPAGATLNKSSLDGLKLNIY